MPDGKQSTTAAWRRWSIYGLLMGDILALKIPRLSIPSMIPFIVAELGLPQSSVPALLSAFHPGYVASNLPGGPLVQRFGAKIVGLVGIAGTAVLFGLMSSVGIARTHASSLLMGLMLVMGILQGPLSPVLMQTNQQWIPTATAADKVERTWSIRLQSLMHSFAPASPWLSPRVWQRASTGRLSASSTRVVRLRTRCSGRSPLPTAHLALWPTERTTSLCCRRRSRRRRRQSSGES